MIDAGAPKNAENLVAAQKQMIQRSLLSIMAPQSVTAAECADAATRFHKIAGEHDGAPMPAWAQQMVHQQQQSMQQIDQRLDQMDRRIQQMDDGMQQFQQNITDQLTQFHQNTTDQLVLIQQEIAKSRNSSVVRPGDALVSLPNQNGHNPPAFFPRNLKELRALSGTNCNTLLAFYELQAQGGVESRRLALAIFFGVRRHMY